MPKALKYLFYPLILLITIITAVILLQTLEEKAYPFIPGIIMLPLIGIFILLERKYPYQIDWNVSKGDFGSDLIRTFLVLPVASKLGELLMIVLLYFPILWLTDFLGGSVLTNDWGLGINFTIALLLSEFFYYWLHRFSHNNKRLWSMHAVHHGAERVYWANAGRFHFLDAFLGGIAYFFPVVMLGPSPEVIVLLLTVSSITGILEHVNIDFRAGFLNYIFNTSELHRWHHSQKEKESNSNFGKVLIVWDLLFGTFFWPKQRIISAVGIENQKVPNGFLSQGIYPYRKKQK